MAGPELGLGETADMTRSSVESFALAEIASRAEEIDVGNEFPRDPRPPAPLLGYVSAGTHGGSGVPPQ